MSNLRNMIDISRDENSDITVEYENNVDINGDSIDSHSLTE